MAENGQVKTDVEILKRDMELLAGLAEKFDIAIDRLSDVSASVDKMLAVHENRLENQEQQREILHQRISQLSFRLNFSNTRNFFFVNNYPVLTVLNQSM